MIFAEWGFQRKGIEGGEEKREAALKEFFGVPVSAWQTDLFWIDGGTLNEHASKVEKVLEEIVFKDPLKAVHFAKTPLPWPLDPKKKWFCLEKKYKPGVTDNTGFVLSEAVELVLKEKLPALSGKRLYLGFESPQIDEERISRYGHLYFHNELIENFEFFPVEKTHQSKAPVFLNSGSNALKKPVEISKTIPLTGKTEAELLTLSEKSLWALSLDEMKAIQGHFQKENRDPTDVELECIAQTWSEHCKHKIFSAEVEISNQRNDVQLPARVDSVFKTYIKGATQKVNSPFLQSVFEDNAGIISIDEKHSVAIKVETHNSPSALDPYGGALTGVVGVNRDILGVGMGAKPIANLDVFCVGSLDHASPLPPRLHHPQRILEGIHLGIEHGGNKSGIPTITGALEFHSGYLGKPLVFCGTVGYLPNKKSYFEKNVSEADLVVMVGGRIGKDGIHGATFSSLALDESSPVSAVQLGDPLTQRRVWDFLLEARDLELYSAITDNGAGGLSSSVGEMARLCRGGKKGQGGARIDVALAKTKYPGLNAYELLVSESQERMTLAVSQNKLEEFKKLAELRNVEISVLGEFCDSGFFEIFYEKTPVGKISMDFLHEGTPKLKLKAKVKPPVKAECSLAAPFYAKNMSVAEILPELLSHPLICSRRGLMESYDHEVQAMTMRKPYGTKNRASPGDGGVICLDRESKVGVSVGLGLAPRLAPVDARLAAALALDEAVRNVVASGGDPEHMALVDNFCWPDPLPSASNPDAEEKMGDLILSAHALYEGACDLGLPFVSGKDSMKNDYRMGGEKISVPPTVLVTAMAKVHDTTALPRAQVKAHESMDIFWVSPWKGLSRRSPTNDLGHPIFDFKQSKLFFIKIHELVRRKIISVLHDVSDGGWLVATSEILFGTGMSAQVSLSNTLFDPFFEPFSSFVLAVDGQNRAMLETELQNFFCFCVGSTSLRDAQNPTLEIVDNDDEVMICQIKELEKSYLDAKSLKMFSSVVKNEEEASGFVEDEAVLKNFEIKKKAASALVLYGDGINCQEETMKACQESGFKTDLMHVNDFVQSPRLAEKILKQNQFIVLPGGFSYGDELGSGRILGLKLKHSVGGPLKEFLDGGGLMLGICNGFQVLMNLGVFGEGLGLYANDHGKFLNRWVSLQLTGQSIFTKRLERAGVQRISLPMRHGEGRILFQNESTGLQMQNNQQCVFRYTEDVNGSWLRVAGLSSFEGRVLGLMPHPEAFWTAALHPWQNPRASGPLGLELFRSAYEHL